MTLAGVQAVLNEVRLPVWFLGGEQVGWQGPEGRLAEQLPWFC